MDAPLAEQRDTIGLQQWIQNTEVAGTGSSDYIGQFKLQSDTEEINEVVEQLCTNVSELRADTEQTELGMQQPQTTSTSVVVVDGHLQQREADDIGVELAPVVTANHRNGSGNNEADELAKLRFGIVERIEIAISSHGFDNLLRSIGRKIWVKQPCQKKRIDRRCKTKTKVNNAAAKSTKRTSGVDAGAERGKRLHRSDFGQVMAPHMCNSQEDPIYRMCLQLPGMPIVTAHLIFQINQFLCQFISFIPKEALGEINNKHSFTLFNTSIVKKALQERETPQLLEDKMMSTLATTVKYAQNYAQCQEGISKVQVRFGLCCCKFAVTLPVAIVDRMQDSDSAEKAKVLMKELEEIDAQLQRHGAQLAENNIGMNEPLVDENGYPRNDVNIYLVRTARHAIVCLQNDRKEKMKEIDAALLEVHAQTRPEYGEEMETDEQQHQQIVHRTSNNPFVQVDGVSPDSPAQAAGLSKGDLIIQFGPLHADIFNKMNQIKEVVERNVNKPIRITAMRGGRVQKLQLVPRAWNGAGLVGCVFIELEGNK
uniref:Nas2_N domain-containing protein n=1 Tax=Globodera pallida TaxID=36090 RepID=A0A183BTN3_GLOPA